MFLSRTITSFLTGSTPTASRATITRVKALHRTSTHCFSSSSSSLEYSPLASIRSQKSVSLLPTYLTDARAVERYHPIHSPNGALQLSVAENQMLEDVLEPTIEKYTLQGIQEDETTPTKLFSSSQIYYQPTHGRSDLISSASHYLQWLLELSKPLHPQGIVVGAGCNAVLENLIFCLTDAGDGVLVPAPYYAAFEFDLVARADVQILPVTGEGEGVQRYYPTAQYLEKARDAALQRNVNPKVLLLSHPNNPLGVCYPEHIVQECIDWCRENKIHLISDEIYAGSVYKRKGEDGTPTFTSALKLASSGEEGDTLGLGPYIHFVYALSKDFALSGLRVGVSYSENSFIRLPMQKLNDLCQISSQTQVLVSNMLNDQSFVEEFIQDIHLKRLEQRSEQLQRVLKDCEIPFLTPDSGLFIWIDLREFLNASERELYLELVKEFGLLMTPGESMRNTSPGFFRCVFTAATDHEFDLALDRIRGFVRAKRGG